MDLLSNFHAEGITIQLFYVYRAHVKGDPDK